MCKAYVWTYRVFKIFTFFCREIKVSVSPHVFRLLFFLRILILNIIFQMLKRKTIFCRSRAGSKSSESSEEAITCPRFFDAFSQSSARDGPPQGSSSLAATTTDNRLDVKALLSR